MEPWQQKVEDWRQSSLRFVTECLQAKPEPWQARLLSDVDSGYKRFTVRAGHGVGKTTIESWLVLWFLLFKRPCKIPITANSQDQLRDVVWAEIAKWHREMPTFMRDLIDIGADRVWIKGDPEGAFAVARTARPEKPEALQGFHADNLMFLIEEASGIEDIIFETAGGALTGEHSYVFMFGNPTRLSGYFFRSHHQNRDRWRVFHVPCSASSRVSPAYAEEIAAEYGEQSNVYRVRVLGEFPLAEDDAVIPLGLVEAAIGREVGATESAVVWGLDVARFGDDSSALAKRRGNTLLAPVKEWRKIDLMQTAGKVYAEWNETPPHDRPGAINVDVIGMGGGVVDRLRELGLPVRGVNVGEAAATDEKRYMRLRDELWFKVKDWFDSRAVNIPQDDGLISELVSPKYKYESTGKLKVESKDDMKKRGVRSPNKADAFCLTFAGGDMAGMLRQRQAVSDWNPIDFSPDAFERHIRRQEQAGAEYRPW
jgi:phage terminase large subunit